MLYRFICKPVRSMQLPVVHLHTPDFADRSLLNSQQVLAQHLRGLRGLLVEDNPLSKRVLQLTLVDRVRELIAVESVAEAQERFSPGRYDFIIVDVRSLGERGVDLAQSVRRQERAAEEATGQPVSLLALTAFPTDAERARCLNAGFNHYLAKPFSNEQLYRAIVGGR